MFKNMEPASQDLCGNIQNCEELGHVRKELGHVRKEPEQTSTRLPEGKEETLKKTSRSPPASLGDEVNAF